MNEGEVGASANAAERSAPVADAAVRTQEAQEAGHHQAESDRARHRRTGHSRRSGQRVGRQTVFTLLLPFHSHPYTLSPLSYLCSTVTIYSNLCTNTFLLSASSFSVN